VTAEHELPPPSTEPKPFPRLLLALPLLLMAGLGALYWKGMSVDPNTLPSPVLNQPVPAFSLPTLRPAGLQLNETALQGPALINVWASWCIACRDENPELLRLKEKGVVIYGVDNIDKETDAHAWLDQYGDPYALVLFDMNGQFARNMGLYGTPETYVIDAGGIVRYRHIGQVSTAVAEDLQRRILELSVRD
jgi:cytochrome c biogenesis protein CcmG/thiol:disulfide interchange protein DsbE